MVNGQNSSNQPIVDDRFEIPEMVMELEVEQVAKLNFKMILNIMRGIENIFL